MKQVRAGVIHGGLWVLVFTLISVSIYAQQRVALSVTDSVTALPMSDAIVRYSPVSTPTAGKTTFTGADGSLSIDYTTPLLISISYLGYTTLWDTIRQAGHYQFTLHKQTAYIEDVVITGQYAPNASKNSLYEVKVLTDKDFAAKGATNLREALMGQLNIDMAQDNVFGSGISLNGISGEGVKIMIDGVPIVGRLDGKLDLNQINLANIERVEIVKGPMSVIYGTDAMGGVVNLITKSNQKEKVNANAKFYCESVGQYNAEANVGLRIGKSQLYMAGGRNFFYGYSVIDTSRHKDWRPREQYFANAKYLWTSARLRIGLTASYFQELMLDRGNLRPYSTYAFDVHYLTQRPQATLTLMAPIGTHAQIDGLLSYSGFFRHTDYYKKDLVTLVESIRPDQSPDTTTYHQVVARLSYTMNHRSGKFSFLFGTDNNIEFAKGNTVAVDSLKTMYDDALYGSVRIHPVKGLDIQPAARIGYNSKFSTPIIPSLNIKYDFLRYFSLRASYGRAFRAPSLKELYLSFHDSNHDLIGNANLTPEDGHNIALGFTYQTTIHKHGIRFASTGFFNLINNKIDLIYDLSTSPVQGTYMNVGRYMTAGGEHTLDYHWDRLQATASATYIWYSVDSSGQSRRRLISPDVTAQISYTIPKAELTIRLGYKYTGKKLIYTVNSSQTTGTRDPYHTLDISMARNFWHDRIQLNIGAKNILNVTNIATPGAIGGAHTGSSDNTLIGWGRTYFISLVLHYGA